MASTRPSPLALVILTGVMIAMLATASHAGSKIPFGAPFEARGCVG
jgi:hypothetical protein